MMCWKNKRTVKIEFKLSFREEVSSASSLRSPQIIDYWWSVSCLLSETVRSSNYQQKHHTSVFFALAWEDVKRFFCWGSSQSPMKNSRGRMEGSEQTWTLTWTMHLHPAELCRSDFTLYLSAFKQNTWTRVQRQKNTWIRYFNWTC